MSSKNTSNIGNGVDINRVISINREDIFNHLKLSCQLPSILEGVITYKIIQAKAVEIDMTVKPEELQQAADHFRLAQKLYTIENTYAWLEKHHLSLDEFENLIYTNTLSQKLMECLFGDRVECFFSEHQLDYAGVAMYEVILDDDDLARELFCALQKDEISFHEVACQYISQSSLRRAGGYRGIMRRQDLKSEIADAVFNATPPQLLRPIITAQGVHLIQVEEIIQPKLDEQLRLQILSELFSCWLKEQIEEVEVVMEYKVLQENGREK
jgi:parvulin-like peptidyl-prolyl isomerase